MAKVTIILEDVPGGGVKTTINPNISTLMKGVVNGHEITAAEGYAVFVANQLREQSKFNGMSGIEKTASKLNLVIPKVKI